VTLVAANILTVPRPPCGMPSAFMLAQTVEPAPCGQVGYGWVSPGAVWTAACFHHFGQAAKKGWATTRVEPLVKEPLRQR